MIENIPSGAKVVIIGGGVAGCSTAYHLAKYGWNDVVLLERDQLTSGTTWHAAGLIGQLGASATLTKIRNHSLNLYKELENETDLSTGLKQNGSLTVATTQGRLDELKRQVTTAQLFNVDASEVSIEKIMRFIDFHRKLIKNSLELECCEMKLICIYGRPNKKKHMETTTGK